jgi:uncharacterized membrane protein YphA (DoxX/SURF4 family)
MNRTLWVLQVLFAVFFFVTGHGKVFTPWDQLQHIPWIDGVTPGLMIFIGWAEMIGAVGVLLPSVLRIQPKVAPVASAGLVLIMIIATVFHIVRGEMLLTIPCIVLGAIGSFIIYGRLRKSPIKARGVE